MGRLEGKVALITGTAGGQGRAAALAFAREGAAIVGCDVKAAESRETVAMVEANGGTRLISRNRFRLPKLVARIGMLPMEPGSLIMESKKLRGIKQRAEHLSSETLNRPS